MQSASSMSRTASMNVGYLYCQSEVVKRDKSASTPFFYDVVQQINGFIFF